MCPCYGGTYNPSHPIPSHPIPWHPWHPLPPSIPRRVDSHHSPVSIRPCCIRICLFLRVQLDHHLRSICRCPVRVPCTWAASTWIQPPSVRGPELSMQSAWKRSSASGCCWVDESTFVGGPFRWRNVVMDGAIQDRRNFAGCIVWGMAPTTSCTVTKISIASPPEPPGATTSIHTGS